MPGFNFRETSKRVMFLARFVVAFFGLMQMLVLSPFYAISGGMKVDLNEHFEKWLLEAG